MISAELSEVPKVVPKDALLRILESLIERTCAVSGSLHACGLTVQHVRYDSMHGETKIRWMRNQESGSSAEPCSVSVGLPWNERWKTQRAHPIVVRPLPLTLCTEEELILSYGGSTIGTVKLGFADARPRDRYKQQQGNLGREIALAVKRQELMSQAREYLNIDLLFAGNSLAFRGFEMEIEKVSRTSYPVIVEGEFGSHALHAAAAIHLAGARTPESFITVDCAFRDSASLKYELESIQWQRCEGTLFLNGIDLLDLPAQRQLLRALRDGSPRNPRSPVYRLVVSTQRPLEALVREESFCRLLYSEVDYLRVRIPTLRERREDIPALIECCLARHGRFGPRQVAPEVWKIFQQYDWPENESELERVATRLTVMTERESVGMDELRRVVSWAKVFEGAREAIHQVSATPFHNERSGALIGAAPVFSEVVGDDISSEPAAGEELGEEESDLTDEEAPPAAAEYPDAPQGDENGQWRELAKRLVAGEFKGLDSLGTGIARALRYVATHYCEDISLGQLARESYISPSHLSFLFKRSIGMPFKAVLASVRIERAQQLLASPDPESITNISLDVGFGDLSHFERTFKRLVGKNPREFRRQALEMRQLVATSERNQLHP